MGCCSGFDSTCWSSLGGNCCRSSLGRRRCLQNKNGRVGTGHARRGDPSRPSREEAEHRGGLGAAGANAVRSATELRGIRQAALRPVCTKQQRSGWWGRVGRTHDHDEGQRDEHHTTDVRRRWRGKTLRKGGVGLMPDERKSKRKPKEKDCNRKVPLLQQLTEAQLAQGWVTSRTCEL